MSITIKGKCLNIACAMALAASAFFASVSQVKAADAISIGMGQSAIADSMKAMGAAGRHRCFRIGRQNDSGSACMGG